MPYFDRFDICKAYYCFACLYHSGQWSDTYKIFGRLEAIKFKPGIHGDDPDYLGENAREIFDNLVEKHGFEPYESEDDELTESDREWMEEFFENEVK